MSDHLVREEERALNDLLEECSQVLFVEPEYANLGKHDIKLTTNTSIRSNQYPVTFSFKQTDISIAASQSFGGR